MAYCAVGAFWVTVSYLAVHTLVADPAILTWLQMLLGLVFVAVSTVLLFGLVSVSRHDLERANRDLERVNDRLDRSLTQSSILQRILRHNLRNSCNVIAGNAALIESRSNNGYSGPIERINRQTDRLVDLGEKSGALQRVLDGDACTDHRFDLTDLVESTIERLEARYPDAAVRTTLPDRLVVETDPDLEIAVRELIENAIVHDDDSTVHVTATQVDDSIEVLVADTGPGVPGVERETLEQGVETPIVHSDGLGLWIAHTIVTRADGTLDIESDPDRGTTVTVRLPATEANRSTAPRSTDPAQRSI